MSSDIIRPNSNNFLHLPGICTISRPFSRSTLGQPTTHGGRRSNSILEFYDRDTNGNVLEEASTAALVLHFQVGRCSIIDGTMPLRLIWCETIYLVDQVALIHRGKHLWHIMHSALYSCDSFRCMVTPDFLPKKPALHVFCFLILTSLHAIADFRLWSTHMLWLLWQHGQGICKSQSCSKCVGRLVA